jgi:hypothetical protein
MKISNNAIINEITAIVKYFHMWSLLGWFDIKQRYRRSMIGPFWIQVFRQRIPAILCCWTDNMASAFRAID